MDITGSNYHWYISKGIILSEPETNVKRENYVMTYVWDTPLGPVHEGDEVGFLSLTSATYPIGKLTAFFSDRYTTRYHSGGDMTVRRAISRITSIIPAHHPQLIPEPLDLDII